MGKQEKLLAQAQEHLDVGERIDASVLGTYEAKVMGTDSVRKGLLIATDRRVVFYAKKIGGFELESYPYANISSLDQGKNLQGHKVTIYASGNKAEVKWIHDTTSLAAFMNVATANIHAKTTTPIPNPAAAPAASEAAATSTDIASQIKQLGELRDAGLLTEDEFAAKKADLLSRM